MQNDADQFENAVLALRLALSERTRERSSSDWAESRQNLGLALLGLGKARRSRAILIEGRSAIADARDGYSEADAGYHAEYDDVPFEELLVQFDKALAALD
ncbi:hypothetical protein [Devosia sp.]|jgi:hypothetical protein|uniref:hypothetical protein n=1 Tax=Devosia sp. TaxID=1871048 RepID=UPI0037BE49B7